MNSLISMKTLRQFYIDPVFVPNADSLLLLDVGELCFNLPMHYHCPVYGVFNFIKPKYKCSDRTIWKYDQGDYENLRRNHVFDWNSISDINVDKYANNLTEVLSNDAKLFIPNKKVTINPHEPPWITCNIKIK